MINANVTVEITVESYATILDKDIIKEGRKKGNSTRQLNRAIEYLFSGHPVVVEDHHDNGKNRNSNRELLNSIIDRLMYEHSINTSNIKVSYTNIGSIIELI